MSREEIVKKLETIVSKKTKTKIEEESTLKDLGIDSLDILDMIVEVEDAFDIALEDELIIELKSVNDIVEAILEKKA